MNKFFNKGLLYQWFNSAKASIFIGIIAWGLCFDRIILNQQLDQIKWQISDNQSDYFISAGLNDYIILGIIFIIIYYMAGGVNKRNTLTFLSSGPFTKKQIKYNEFIGLIITLFLFLLCTIYISITFYIRNRELLSIVNGYFYIIFLQCLKIILLGTLGILFMLVVDTLFSNTIVASIALIFVIPESIFLIWSKVIEILRYIDLGNQENIFDKIGKIFYSGEYQMHNHILLIDYIYSSDIRLKRLFVECVIVLAIIVLGIMIFDICQNRYKLENCNKIFSSTLNEKIVLVISSLGGASIFSFIFITDYIERIAIKDGMFVPLSGIDMIKTVGIEIFSIALIACIIYSILKKLLKKII